MNESATSVNILGREYPLKFSANAAKKVQDLYGGVGRAADALTGEDKTLDKIGVAINLVSILATEGARAHNFAHPDEEKIPDLPPDVAGTVLTLVDINEMSPKLAEAIKEGSGRSIVSEDDEKNIAGA